MKLLKLDLATVEYTPEIWRDDDDPPVITLRVLTGLEVEKVEEAESRRLQKRGTKGVAAMIAIRDAVVASGIAKIEGLQGADGSEITTGDQLIAALQSVDAKIYDAVMSDLAEAIRDHSKLTRKETKN